MYIWKTNKLAEDLKENKVSQTDFKRYYLISSVILSISVYFLSIEARPYPVVCFFETVGVIIVTIFGLNLIFKANGGDDGKDYLNRVISLSLPVMIKSMVIAFLIGIVIGILELSGISKEYLEYCISLSIVFVDALILWRVKVHVQCINS